MLQYTSGLLRLHGNKSPICIALPSWLPGLEERETTIHLPFVLQYASYIFTAVCLVFVRQCFCILLTSTSQGPRVAVLRLSGPTATVTVPVVLHCRATLCRITFPRMWRGVTGESRYTPSKAPVAPSFAALKGGVALQVASWKVSRHKGVSQLHCRLSHCNGPLNSALRNTLLSSTNTLILWMLRQ